MSVNGGRALACGLALALLLGYSAGGWAARPSRHWRQHLWHLCGLNTMVGTAAANTASAGLFGRGSEEHGQTMPAVLVPNGQNFWTPQTRAGEAKCQAPYYYADDRLQGIRNSHWTSGSCTQDYGSFTRGARHTLQPPG